MYIQARWKAFDVRLCTSRLPLENHEGRANNQKPEQFRVGVSHGTDTQA